MLCEHCDIDHVPSRYTELYCYIKSYYMTDDISDIKESYNYDP